MVLHVIGLHHTAINKEYSCCAFTQKILNMCKMFKMSGHKVYLYANEGSCDGPDMCDEFIKILPSNLLLHPVNVMEHETRKETEAKFNKLVTGEIFKRYNKNDFLICPWLGHEAIAQHFKGEMIVVESGIGYGHAFAPYKIFESYAAMHAWYGLQAVTRADKIEWYSRVIPNFYDQDDFEYEEKKQPYALFLGMRHGGVGKGYQIAVDAARDAAVDLHVAGPDTPKDSHKHVKYLGMIGIEERKKELANACAVIAPSLYIEPFCGAQVEGYISGTPCISTDWGAFAEYNVHGTTGYRCMTHAQFVQAINNCKAGKLNPAVIREYGHRFTLEKIRHKYDNYFEQVYKIFEGGKGWYDMSYTGLDDDWF